MMMKSGQALLVLDVINEIVHPDGKYAKEGYFTQVERTRLIENTQKLIHAARENDIPIIYVVVGFSQNYVECPESSSVFSLAKRNELLKINTWGTQVYADISPRDGDIILVKNRVSPFYQTNLDLILRQLNIKSLLLTGVSTEFVVLSTAADAHDRDYSSFVFEDATAAVDEETHLAALKLLANKATVLSVENFLTSE
ncbi:cysteine hydrolase [Photobacterium sp. WH77]|uniref:Cysteine hydrolase n=1 Tax=Photobacterium arenosum TaxID=2774143 RepID=A0ABR9BM43_9GAMM|nr:MULTISPECIES: isochorismatase family cysteine hydrolase [Photobacterium]MBD8513643.1 cysteine hydrolase [Photobacterium arenosum]MCG2838011.1 cysteine hydrolase [Photobacterium sp. WH77]MCG2845629.1 cysteine hydrolase [Photobacterium sp. WH80]MDO6583657.1 isochorismatase family cysteine hydrolase [Photobacterium sp. 2_MG-2023]